MWWMAGLVVCLAIIPLFYAEELWRGKRAWENCRHNLESEGVKIDWTNYIPPAVPDDENVLGTPFMQDWLGRYGMKLFVSMPPNKLNLDSLTPEIAANFLRSNAVFEQDFDTIRVAVRRPSTWMSGDYSKPEQAPTPNARAIFALMYTLEARARCHLLLRQPNEAENDITLMDDSARALYERQKPVCMLAAWLNVLWRGSCAKLISRGIRSNCWSDSQLTEFENRLKSCNLLQPVSEAFALERAIVCSDTPSLEHMARKNYVISSDNVKQGDWNEFVAKILPAGWAYQGAAARVQIDARLMDSIHADDGTIELERLKSATMDLQQLSPHWTPKSYLFRIPIPADKICQTTAYFQTQVNETLIVCALERYKLAKGRYPEKLEILAPQFIEKIPRDVIGGGMFHYHASDTNTFVLYSPGWKGRDGGGTPGKENYPYTDGDWVWQADHEK